MIQRLLFVTFMLMCVVVTVVGQNARHDDLPLQERANRLEPYIAVAALRHGVDARILRAICFIESGFRINVVSPKGARGPMQFMPGTAARYGLREPHNPEQAIDAGARYFRDLLRKFGGRVDLALAAYNAGEAAVSSFMRGRPLVLPGGKIVNAEGRITGGVPPYAETQRYVRSVLALVSHGVVGPAKRSNARFRPVTRRGLTVVAFDVSERAQKLSRTHPSSFIEVH